ncbi:hypothetical protein CFC21_016655 [Triticum aestivum]|uniref:Uncharacterized protein n=2 Tax=Triticum aestivum TaxID=4565 RepID=A0A9R1J1I0_WHEAT|nr:hypothetical protein CFC21_016655 [Triticum aestivum]
MVFNVKPKVVGGEHAECGGAMVSKMPNVIWPTGTFNDYVKEWQQQWFYIIEPSAPRGLRAPVAAPSIGDPSNRATSQPLRHPSRSPSSHRPSPSLRGELFQGEELLSCSCMPLPPSTANPLTSLAPPEPKFGAASPP